MKVGPAVLVLAGAALSSAARADQVMLPTGLVVEVTPVFSTASATGQVVPSGWNQVLVRIRNVGQASLRGEVHVSDRQFAGRGTREFKAIAPYSVNAGASIHLRIPVEIAPYSTVGAELHAEDGTPLWSTSFSTFNQQSLVLVDVSEASRVRDAINEVPVVPRYNAPTTGPSRGGGGGPALLVTTPRFDPATGDPLLPDRAPTYGSADAVLVRSDLLARLAGDELEALARYVLGGGTLAIAVARPEDLRHATLVSFAGGSITKTPISAVALGELVLPVPLSASGGAAGKRVPAAKNPLDETMPLLAGYRGGNLRGSPYGNSAPYGLGEVHFLAFDPSQKAVADDPWAQARLVDLVRRGYDRRSTLAFWPGGAAAAYHTNGVRKELDPNESSRWAIAAAALLLCIYAILAGPVNFARASRAGRPLQALFRLPLWAAGAFAAIVAIGTAAKGVRGRARHLTLVEAGAGMVEGTARRYRGFYASSTQELTVRTTDRTSVVSTAIAADGDERKDRMLVDRDGARLVGVAALPWQTVVVREDGAASLGDGISITKDGEDALFVTNRTGRPMRGALLRLPGGTTVVLGRIADGEKASSQKGRDIAGLPQGADWERAIRTTLRFGTVDVHRLAATDLHGALDEDAPGLSDAWKALEEAAGEAVDWFPPGAPVLIAQLDGGEGRRADSKLGLDRDRLLVRVVGLGGKP